MAYPDENKTYVMAPTSLRMADIRILHGMVSSTFEGLTQEEVRDFERACNIADPRYGDNPEGAMDYLKEQGWRIFGTLRKRTMTTADVADQLGISVRRVQALINDRQLPAEKHGRDYVVYASDVEEFSQRERPAHRPTKGKT